MMFHKQQKRKFLVSLRTQTWEDRAWLVWEESTTSFQLSIWCFENVIQYIGLLFFKISFSLICRISSSSSQPGPSRISRHQSANGTRPTADSAIGARQSAPGYPGLKKQGLGILQKSLLKCSQSVNSASAKSSEFSSKSARNDSARYVNDSSKHSASRADECSQYSKPNQSSNSAKDHNASHYDHSARHSASYEDNSAVQTWTRLIVLLELMSSSL